jgi:PAS domain S-box-containing protein
MVRGERPEHEAEPPEHALLTSLREHDLRERVFETLPDAAVVVDARGVVADLNRRAAELLGRSRDERLDVRDLVAGSAAVPQPRAGAPATGAVTVRRADGSTVEAWARSYPIGDGEPMTLVLLSDVEDVRAEVASLQRDRERIAIADEDAAEEASRTHERMQRLQAITDVALVHLSLDELFDALLGRLTELVEADAAAVLLLDPIERVLRVRATHGLERPPEQRPDVPLGAGVAGRIAARRQATIIGDLRRARPVSPFLHSTLRSLAGVPILHQSEVIGVLHVGSVRPRWFAEDDVALLEIVAARLAPAIANAQLHESERLAREAAEQDAARLRLVQDVAEVLGTLRPLEEMGEVVLERLIATIGATAGAITLLDDDGRALRILSAVGYDEATVRRWERVPLDLDVPVTRAVRERRDVLIGTRAERDALFPDLEGTPSVGGAWASLPLIVDDRPVGALALTFPGGRSFDELDADVLSAVAHQCAQGVDRARRYDAERTVAERAEASTWRLRLLQSLTARYSRALSPREVAEVTVAEAAGSLGAISGAFFTLDEEGMFRLEASYGYDEETLAPWRRFPADLPTPGGDALRTGDIVVTTTPEDHAERYPSVAAVAGGRLAGPTATIPVVVDDRSIAVAAFTFTPERALSEDDHGLLAAVGRQAGQALERARLYETERRARREAERARERVERLSALAADLAEAGTGEEVATALSEHVLAAIGGNASAVALARDERRLEIVASRGYPQEAVERYRHLDVDDALPLAETVRTRVGIWVPARSEMDDRYPGFVADLDRIGTGGGLAAVPLKVADRVLGAVTVQTPQPHDWSQDEKEFLRSMARSAAQAVDAIALRGAGSRARTQLERSERRYRSLIESTTAIHWTVDPAGAFIEPQSSWEAYTGQPWDEHRGFGWIDAVHPDDRETVMDTWVTARDHGTLFSTELRLRHGPSGTHRTVSARAAPVHDDDGRIVEWVGTINDIHDRREEQRTQAERERAAREEIEAASERLAYLASASTILATSLDLRQTLQRLADLTVPRLADWCAVDMLGEDGEIELVAVAHVDPRKVELAYDLRRRYPPDPEDDTGMPKVLRTGRPFLMEEIPAELLDEAKRRNPELADLVDELQLRSMMVVPIAAGERVLGAMTFVWAESGERYDRHDLALAEDLARRAAVAVENARLFERERDARAEEERARTRVEIVAEAGAAMAASLEPRRVVEALARVAAHRIADAAVVYLVDRFGRVEDYVVAHREPSIEAILRRATSLRLPTPEDGGAVAAVLRTSASVTPQTGDGHVDAPELTDEQREILHSLNPMSEAAIPLMARDRLLGVFWMLRTAGSRKFDDDDVDLATDITRRASLHLENARLYEEREEIAETLQKSLLPPDAPQVPGLDVGARYLAAAQGLTVGGDFYDIFELDMDHWGVVIGDVVGKGAPAAAVMGLARYTVRTAAMSEGRPSALLQTLNDAIARQTQGHTFCTACFARLRRHASGVRVTLAVGGHPLPLLVRSSGDVEEVGEPGTLLGIFEDPTLVDRAVDLRPGDALVLYTDGVTDERRGEEEFGIVRLRDVLARLAGSDAQRIADGVVAAIDAFRTGDVHDDIALVVLRVKP